MRRTRTRGERGSAILLVMLMMIPTCAVIGLVTDIGWFYYTREAAQSAADAAVIAGVKAAMDGITAGGTYTCGSKTLVCQAETSCATSIRLPLTSTAQNACLYATANGFSNGGLNGRQTVAISANVTSPAPTAPGAQVQYWVSAHITQRTPLTFLGVLGGQYLTVAVRSTAGVINAVTPTCLTVLDPTDSPTLSVSNGTSVTLSGCNAQVNSGSATAVQIKDGSSLTAQSIQIVGNYTATNGSIITTPTTGVSAISDPLASVPVPSFTPGHCDYTNIVIRSNTTQTLSPGNYCGGISVSNGGAASFNSGTYVLLGGGFNVANGGAVTGTGVTFYNTCTSGSCQGGSTGFQPFYIDEGASAILSGPSSGSLSGILFFEDRTVSSSSDQISDGARSNLSGTIYLPKGSLSYLKGVKATTTSTVLDVWSVAFSDGSSFLQTVTTTGSSGPSTPMAAILR